VVVGQSVGQSSQSVGAVKQSVELSVAIRQVVRSSPSSLLHTLLVGVAEDVDGLAVALLADLARPQLRRGLHTRYSINE
jgi:hypothetical protein